MSEEDYPDQNREIKIQDAIDRAVEAADEIILDASDGTVEETDYITAKVAEKLFDKVVGRVSSVYLAHRLKCRLGNRGA